MARLIGINHVALEVGDVEEALAWYGRFFEFELRGRIGSSMAFIDMGDQFIALAAGRSQPPDQARHFGLVVDDKEGVRAAFQEAGLGVQESGSLDFVGSMGQSRSGRGVPRYPVHQGAGSAAGHGPRRAPEDRGGARGAPSQGRHRLEPSGSSSGLQGRGSREVVTRLPSQGAIDATLSSVRVSPREGRERRDGGRS